MTKQNDLLNDVEENIENSEQYDEMHDPKNAESKSNDSVDKAGKTGPIAKKRPNDKTDQENGGKPYKTDKGIVREMYAKMQDMDTEQLKALHSIVMDENFSSEFLEDDDILGDVTYDMSEDISDLIESEATLSEGFKDKASVIMEMAVKSKLKPEIDRLEEAYSDQLEEAKTELADQIDQYLTYAVECWMTENELAIETGLRTEIAENFMNGLKDLFEESYITVPEDKVDLVDGLAEQVESLEQENNNLVEQHITLSEEIKEFKRDAIILEFSDDLADTQFEKLTKLAEALEFKSEESFRDSIETIKETYFGKKTSHSQVSEIHEDAEGSGDDDIVVSETMTKYVNALNKRT